MTIRSVVLGCGSYLPQRVVTNAELASRIDTSDEWIVQRTGIRERHLAGVGEQFRGLHAVGDEQQREVAHLLAGGMLL